MKDTVAAIKRSQAYLLSLQHQAGFWWGELESNVSITAEVVLLHKIWRTDRSRPLHKVIAYLRSQQRTSGGWELFYGDGGELSVSVEAYLALRLLGVPADDPALVRARRFILDRGGISRTRIFTRFHLALVGCYDWRGLPSLPPWIMLLPSGGVFSIYELSSWARSSTVPLIIPFYHQPVFPYDAGVGDADRGAVQLDELYCEGVENVVWEFPRQGDWTDIFVELDGVLRCSASWGAREGLEAAERWTLDRQEPSGDWAGIIPAMLNALIALRTLNYSVHHPNVVRGMEALDRFVLETSEHYWVQPCVSPVWDTALVMRSLRESGLGADHFALVQAGEWLVDQQILDYGDWAVKSKGAPGGWAFEFDNRFYPDIDDTAMVVMALDQVTLADEGRKQGAIDRAYGWITSMQCQGGGWAAFDIDNHQDWLNFLPYADLKAMIDPNTADVTARVLEMVGRCGLRGTLSAARADRGTYFLLREQDSSGAWFGRWGVNYIYGTSMALVSLSQRPPRFACRAIDRGVRWLLGCQNSDGGWGETCWSYRDPALKGQGPSTPSQTAWALQGLMAGKADREAIDRGIRYLLNTQLDNGGWFEAEFTGTGFPNHFYLKYHLYQHLFPLSALGRYSVF